MWIPPKKEDVRIKYLHSGIPEKVVKMVSKLYEDTKACLRIEAEEDNSSQVA